MRTNNPSMHGNHRWGHQWHGHKYLQNRVNRLPAPPTGLLRRPLGFKRGLLEPLGGRLRTEIRTTNNGSAVVRSLAPNFELISWLGFYLQVHVTFMSHGSFGIVQKLDFEIRPNLGWTNLQNVEKSCFGQSVRESDCPSVCPSCCNFCGELSRA